MEERFNQKFMEEIQNSGYQEEKKEPENFNNSDDQNEEENNDYPYDSNYSEGNEEDENDYQGDTNIPVNTIRQDEWYPGNEYNQSNDRMDNSENYNSINEESINNRESSLNKSLNCPQYDQNHGNDTCNDNKNIDENSNCSDERDSSNESDCIDHPIMNRNYTNAKEDHPLAKRIYNSFPRMYPFEDNDIAWCVKIEPQDIGLFPMDVWVLGNNSFLLHGYYSYRHLIFARINDRDGMHYILGVPGIYHNREKFMAKMFGFERFKCIKKKELRTGEFGYWYIPIILN